MHINTYLINIEIFGSTVEVIRFGSASQFNVRDHLRRHDYEVFGGGNSKEVAMQGDNIAE